MQDLISYFLTVVAAFLFVPASVLLVEVTACIARPRRERASDRGFAAWPRVAALVPAHDESAGLVPTINDIRAQLRAGDRVVVVADNCSDDTALVAAAAGAEVIERADRDKIGKGYALDFGLRYLSANPPDVVIIIDADCRLTDSTIDHLAATCALTGRPAQALDLMKAPDQSAINFQVAEFAWRVRNWVRPLGLDTLGLPCQLMGTGMAFPWAVIRSAKLASGQVVEDLNLGLELAKAGSFPIFCPSAQVTSNFPNSAAAAGWQRQRWEQGHVELILARVPRLIVSAIAGRNLGLLAMVLDLAVPPLVLLVLLATCMLLLTSSAAWLGGSSVALIVSAINFAAIMAAVLLSWIKFGRDILPLRALWSVAPYALGKFGLYRRVLVGGRVSQWMRTDRK